MPLAAAIPLIQAGAGLLQSILGGNRAKKAQRQLEKLESPTYTLNKGILDYYNTALDRYNVSPTDSAMYKRNANNILRSGATGLRALQDKRSAIGGVSSIVRAMNDATLNNEVAAEEQRNQRFGQLGTATGMKANEDDKAFTINQMQPFERKYNILAAKVGAANQTTNTGISNIFNGLQGAANYQLAKDIYGNNNTTTKPTGRRIGRGILGAVN